MLPPPGVAHVFSSKLETVHACKINDHNGDRDEIVRIMKMLDPLKSKERGIVSLNIVENCHC